MLTPAQVAAIRALKPERDYRAGTRRPYRPAPPDFADVFVHQHGWGRAIEDHFHVSTRTVHRWIDECGGEELRRRRREVTGRPPRHYLRTRLPTFATAIRQVLGPASTSLTLEQVRAAAVARGMSEVEARAWIDLSQPAGFGCITPRNLIEAGRGDLAMQALDRAPIASVQGHGSGDDR